MAVERRGEGGVGVVRYRNRDIGEAELHFIRSTITGGGWQTRGELAEIICRGWDWRQANGGWSVAGCLDLLRRLQEWGHVELPPQSRRRRPGVRSANRRTILRYSELPVELIPIAEIPLSDDEADLDSLVVRPIASEERVGWRLYIERYHYLGWRPLVGEYLAYAAFLDTELVALLGWASAAFHVPARERFIGWEEQGKRKRLHLVANNSRFLVLPWVRVRCLASKVLAANLRRLSADWEKAWGHPVHLAETFVDPVRFRGTCYRASNWTYLGQSAGRSKRGNRYLKGGGPKDIYVYDLHRHARAILRGERER